MTIDENEAPELRLALSRMGLAGKDTPLRLTRLTGGVSSDIFLVSIGTEAFVVKRALAKLRVAADWQAPRERNDYELLWLETVGRILPDAVPAVLGHDREAGLFAMRFYPPETYPVWKEELRERRIDPGFAAEVGRRLATIHRATADDASLALRFATDHIFAPIRLAPYLEAAALRHPAAAAELRELSRRTLGCKRALVHGDVSPKNILCGPQGPVFLDAECAWFGDPAFDLAFCLNHLLLKCLWVRGATAPLLAAFDALGAGYLPRVDWEGSAEIEARAASLLPGLLLARVDGKSPVEYLTREIDRGFVRQVALALLARPPARLAEVRRAWESGLASRSEDRHA